MPGRLSTERRWLRNLSIPREDAELEGEAEHGLLVAARLKVRLQQPLGRHHVVTSRVQVLLGGQQKQVPVLSVCTDCCQSR